MTSDKTDLLSRAHGGDFILMDGAMGTELERRGVPFESASWSALALRDHGDVVRGVHQDYLRAGAELHIVNSFALAPHVLEPLGLGAEFERLNRRAVDLFEQAVARSGTERSRLWAAGSLSTFAAHSDRSLLPRGAALVANYRDQARILHDAGVDLFAFEMLFDTDVSLALLQAVEGMGLPVILGFTCEWQAGGADRVPVLRRLDDSARSLEAVLPAVIEKVEPDSTLLSIMHSEADVTDAALEILMRYWNGPVAVYPNSGTFVDLHMQFDSVCPPAQFEQAARRWIDRGAGIVGGCCGIGPEHIAALAQTR